MQRVNQRAALVLVVLSLLLAACGTPGEPTKGEVTVYVAAPLSGFQANGGQTVLGGARLAAEKVNRAGGLLGTQHPGQGEEPAEREDRHDSSHCCLLRAGDIGTLGGV